MQERRLAAIMLALRSFSKVGLALRSFSEVRFTDIVGYTALMGSDGDRTSIYRNKICYPKKYKQNNYLQSL